MVEQLWRQIQEVRIRGDLDSEIQLLQNLVSVAQNIGDENLEIEGMRLLANAYQTKGNLQLAHSYRLTGLNLAERPESSCSVGVLARIEGDIARTFLQIGDWEKAIYYTQRALQKALLLNDEELVCVYKLNLGKIYANTDRLSDAIVVGLDVIQRAQRRQDHYVLGLQYANLASYYLIEGKISESLRNARQSLIHANMKQDIRLQIGAKAVYGQALRASYILTGNFSFAQEAIERYQESLNLAQTLGDVHQEFDATRDIAQIYKDVGQTQEALKYYESAVLIQEKIRSGMGYDEFLLSHYKNLQPLYDSILQLQLRLNKRGEAFVTIEQSRSRLLLALLDKQKQQTHRGKLVEDKSLLEAVTNYGSSVLAQIVSGNQALSSRGVTIGLWSPHESDTVSIDSDTADVKEARQKFLEYYEAGRLNQVRWQKRNTSDLANLADMQHILSSEEAIIIYTVASDSIAIIVVCAHEFHFQHLNYSMTKIYSDVEALASAMASMKKQLENRLIYTEWVTRKDNSSTPIEIQETLNTFNGISEKLYALLIASVRSVIHDKKHLIIMPHGPLHAIPWSALKCAQKYLIQDYTISVLPSASLGLALEAEEPSCGKDAIFFANPDSDSLLALPASQDEATASYQILKKGPKPFIGEEAKKETFLRLAPSARIIHMACHNLFDAKAPILSFLKLAGNSGCDFLYAFEVEELNLSAELISLSACQSGLSGIATGDEQFGMVRAFLAAGARSVISTLWAIDDVSASLFFTKFYSYALNDTLSLALSKAQRELMDNPKYQLPYFWAPYILTGQWKNKIGF